MYVFLSDIPVEYYYVNKYSVLLMDSQILNL